MDTSGLNISYKRLDSSCADKLAELERECFDDAWSEKIFADSLSTSYTQGIGAYDGQELVGYVMWMRVADEFEIINVATKKSVRRCGIGRRLLELCRGYALTCSVSKIILEVRASNTPAINLYTSLGFVQVGVRRNYYKNPIEDAWLMDLALDFAN